MEDKVITIVFGSLGATLALVSILFAYLQLQGFQPAIAPDEEQAVPLDVVAQDDPVTDTPPVTAQDNPVTNPPYVSCLATQLYHRTDNVIDASPRIDLLPTLCQRSTIERNDHDDVTTS